jgi:hypothetical protein
VFLAASGTESQASPAARKPASTWPMVIAPIGIYAMVCSLGRQVFTAGAEGECSEVG